MEVREELGGVSEASRNEQEWPRPASWAAGAKRFILDLMSLDDEAPLPGELPLLTAALDVLVVLFRIGERP